MTTKKMLTWLAVPTLAIAFMLTSVGDTSSADAGGFSLQIGGYGNGFGYRNYRSYRPSYGVSRYNYGGHYGSHYGTPIRNYRSYSQPHLDYHGPSIVPHGNHLDYVPGHYDVHYGSHYGHGGHH